MRSVVVGLSILLLAAACGRTWPSVRPVADAAFVAGGTRVARVDVLPLNVDVSAWEGANVSPDQLQQGFDASATRAIRKALARRGYDVGATIDWAGHYTASTGEEALALYPEQLDAIAQSMSTYGMVQAQQPGKLVEPYLPIRLGEASGADATLYVGGYAFSGHDDDGVSAGTVLKVVLIATVVVVVIAVIAIAAKNSGGGGGGAIGGVARAAGNAAGVVGRAAMGVGRVALSGLGRAATAVPQAALGGVQHAGQATEVTLRMLDAFGRSDTHLALYYDDDRSYDMPVAPVTGPSKMMLEMTLIDNRTGHTLWHARQVFPANAASAGDVDQAIDRMLRTLPQR